MNKNEIIFSWIISMILGIAFGLLLLAVFINIKTVYSINISDWECIEKVIKNNNVECNLYQRKNKIVGE